MENGGKPKRKRSVVWRDVDGETVIISSDNKLLHTLNDIGSRIWVLLDGEHDIDKIASIISSEYGEEKEIVKQDLVVYIENLWQFELLEGR